MKTMNTRLMFRTDTEKSPVSPCDCGDQESCDDQTVQILPAPTGDKIEKEAPCCGKPSYPASSPFEKPGYQIRHFVEDFIDTPIGPIPQIRGNPAWQDRVGTVMARIGIQRDQYTVAPGIYALGRPDPDAPVIVTANYKLTFDTVRKELSGINAWLLVLDTRGINVWCAAGKGTFGSDELISRITATRLANVVRHRELILPQLGATGVSAIKVKKASGFKVTWGPVQARDLKAFLKNDGRVLTEMRQVTFSLAERLVLIPVELYHLPKLTLWVLVGIFVLSGIGTSIFSFSMSWSRGMMAVGAYLAGIIAGTVGAPLLLPWIPGRAFAIKGAIIGMAAALGLLAVWFGSWGGLEALAILLFTAAVSSYLAMNFTGSTPFTSPSGVEKEMRKAIPLQAAALLLATVAWVATPFI